MGRQDREVANRREMLEIMKKCAVCNMAFAADDTPYVMPMNFGVME